MTVTRSGAAAMRASYRRPGRTRRRTGAPVRSHERQSGHNAIVTSTASAPRFESSRVHSLTRPNLVSVGTIIWLSSELMFFAGLFAMYFTMRSVHSAHWPMKLPNGEEINLDLWHGIPAYALP